MTDLEAFTKAYIEAALFSSTDEKDVPLDKNYTDNEIEEDTLEQMKRDAAVFYTFFENVIEEGGAGTVEAGHDFWFTRNGHGVGFWDGDWPEEVGKILTEGSEAFGEYSLSASTGGTVFNLSDPGVPPYFQKGPFDWEPELGKTMNMGIGLPAPKFNAGTVVMTPGIEAAEEALMDANLNFDLSVYLDRHLSGDWGEISAEDKAQNDRMIAEKGMILSAYTLKTGTKIWIITDPGHKVTTLLLPEEY